MGSCLCKQKHQLTLRSHPKPLKWDIFMPVTIVIVEDEPAVMKMLQRMVQISLGQLAISFEFKLFRTVEKAMNFFKFPLKYSHGIVLLDQNLKKSKGSILLQYLIQRHDAGNWSVVMCTGNVFVNDTQLTYNDFGATNCLAKPYTISKISQTLIPIIKTHYN